MEKRSTILPPAAVEPCELQNPDVDWDAILAGAPVSREPLSVAANLTYLRLWADEYDALAAEIDGTVPPSSSGSDAETIRPTYLQAS